MNKIEDVIRNREITTVFQAIVCLSEGVIMGYEALSRGPKGSVLERPDLLFAEAEKCGKLWELELLCRSKALEQAEKLPQACKMFINVDPNVIKDPRFEKGLTGDLLKELRIAAESIVFEITERTAVDDYQNFRRVLENYRSQGYRIAIDDLGAGCSGMTLLAETRPQFIKIDMTLVRDIDRDFLRQALLKALCDFSRAADMKLIAEGIETFAELKTLIEIGVHYGQGFLLQRPQSEFKSLLPSLVTEICGQRKYKTA